MRDSLRSSSTAGAAELVPIPTSSVSGLKQSSPFSRRVLRCSAKIRRLYWSFLIKGGEHFNKLGDLPSNHGCWVYRSTVGEHFDKLSDLLSNHGCWVYRSTHATYYAVLPVRLSLPLTFTPWSGLCLWVCFFFCFILIIPMWWIPLYFSAYCWMMPPSSTRYSCAIKHFFDDNSFSALYMSIMPHSSFLVFVVETCILRDVFYMRLHVFYFELHFILEFAHFIPHYTVDHTPK